MGGNSSNLKRAAGKRGGKKVEGGKGEFREKIG
jgi:hypothetical protein